jgi:gamma-glutamyltranspeptidase/glutathione hydrolase
MDELMTLPYTQRSPVYSTRGMVASSQPLASAAGARILEAGGTAADAAVAMAAMLNLTEPCSTGLGGDAFVLYYQASTRKVFALNGSGRSPLALTLDRLRKEGFDKAIPPTHPYMVTVPGACAAWSDLVERFGKFSLDALFADAIDLAEKGFPVAPITSYFWQSGVENLRGKALNIEELSIDGKGPQPGEIFRNPGLARTLKVIAEGGKQAFYRGVIADAIVSTLKEAGGCMTLEDMAAHKSAWVEPISTVYRGVRVWECPPNGQGITALLALNLLEGFDLASLDPLSTEHLHLEIEALRLAFADARRYVADPDLVPVPVSGLLDKSYSAERRKKIRTGIAAGKVEFGTPLGSSDTVYFCAVDDRGNACSMINSNYMGFGTGIVPHGWGFSLQNRAANFSLDPHHSNALGPGKRPYHTIIPGMLTRESDQSLYAPFGVMGGFMQPQGHVQVVTAMIDHAMNPQAALEMPRFCIQPQDGRQLTSMEEGIPHLSYARLLAMGHSLKWDESPYRAQFGRGQIIRRNPESGVLEAGSDPRADGCAMPVL